LIKACELSQPPLAQFDRERGVPRVADRFASVDCTEDPPAALRSDPLPPSLPVVVGHERIIGSSRPALNYI
jgi:hypothetical protein